MTLKQLMQTDDVMTITFICLLLMLLVCAISRLLKIGAYNFPMNEILYLCSSFVQSPTEPGWHVVESVFFSENLLSIKQAIIYTSRMPRINTMDVIANLVLCTHL